MSDSATPWTAAHQAFLSITDAQSLVKLMSIEQAMPSYHLTLYFPLLLLPSIFSTDEMLSDEVRERKQYEDLEKHMEYGWTFERSKKICGLWLLRDIRSLQRAGQGQRTLPGNLS